MVNAGTGQADTSDDLPGEFAEVLVSCIEPAPAQRRAAEMTDGQDLENLDRLRRDQFVDGDVELPVADHRRRQNGAPNASRAKSAAVTIMVSMSRSVSGLNAVARWLRVQPFAFACFRIARSETPYWRAMARMDSAPVS